MTPSHFLNQRPDCRQISVVSLQPWLGWGSGHSGGVTPQMRGVVLLLWKVIPPEQNQGVPLSWSWILTKRGTLLGGTVANFTGLLTHLLELGYNANAPRNSLVMREVTVWAEGPRLGEVKTGKWEGMCSVSKGSHCPAPARLPSHARMLTLDSIISQVY